MAEPVTDRIIDALNSLPELYHRLLLVVGPPGTGKTSALRRVEGETSGKCLNLNLELCKRMLDMTARQRALQIGRLLTEITNQCDAEILLLDNTEILFDVALKQDPLRLLQSLSRNRTVVATWNGTTADKHLTYAVPGHPEFRRYPVQDLVIVSSDSAGQPQQS